MCIRDRDNITRPIDPYADPQRMSERWIANGDGYLFYPGAKYGADYPFASMRLEAIRDGLEEYEYPVSYTHLYTISFWIFDLVQGVNGVTNFEYASAVGLFFTLVGVPIVMTVRHFINKLVEIVEY